MSTEADCSPSCSVHKGAKLLDSFHRLARDLNGFLALSPSKNFSDIDPNTIINRMREYKSRDSDWLRYAHKDEDVPFTRNLVDPGNGIHNLVCLVKIQAHWWTVRIDADHEMLAYTGVDPWQGKSNPRPCWVALYHEGRRATSLEEMEAQWASRYCKGH